MPDADIAALGFFAFCWLFYEPLIKTLSRDGLLNSDMTVIRGAWMGEMSRRESRFMDGQLLGHALNSASFFASSNLLLIAAAAGVLFGGEKAFASISSLVLIKTSTRLLFELQLSVILIVLARGLLDFIWSIRQMNYCLTIFGATPEDPAAPAGLRAAFAEAAGMILNPALSSFNAGVRGYYFALAAAAWLFGPVSMIIATLGAVSLLVWRQRHSSAARAIRTLRRTLEEPPAQP
ncbi:MAG: DUF599 family protein [Caulobacter sp.]|nr:DUF599 family protein [Caulobacter sp.]